MKTKALIGIAALGAAAFSLPATAQMSMSSAYVGGGFGQSKFKCPTGLSCDDTKDTAFKLFGGYQFNRNIASEVGYTDLGKATGTGGAKPRLRPGSFRLSARSRYGSSCPSLVASACIT